MTERASLALALGASLCMNLGCSRLASPPVQGDGTTGDSDVGNGDGDGDGVGDGDGDGDPDTNDSNDDSWGGHTDWGGDGSDPCWDGACNQIDLLFVIDNSGTMGRKQLELSASFALLFDKLQLLADKDGEPLHPDVNIMFTTTDLGHPECTPLQPEGYMPAQGAPQAQSCTERLDDFTALGLDAGSFPEACTTSCPVAREPIDPFIHFEGPNASVTNVPGNAIVEAMGCIGPQGINGCGYEAPLEAMLQAINPAASWNDGNKPFLRDGAMLAIVIVTDEEDCSVRAPEGYAFFTDPMQDTYWEVNPDTGSKTHATSAVCWNAGVNCGAPDSNGIYADCESIDTDVLHPIDRYLAYLEDELIADQNKEVVMLGILGVPSVTQHNPNPPFEPTAGGVQELVYRDWLDGPWPIGDIIDEGATAASKEFEFGIGPGCTGLDGMGGFTGQAIPPVRVKEVCQALDQAENVRCCIESVCDTDFSDAFGCLVGMIQTVVDPIG
jgi:hypothetical protein